MLDLPVSRVRALKAATPSRHSSEFSPELRQSLGAKAFLAEFPVGTAITDKHATDASRRVGICSQANSLLYLRIDTPYATRVSIVRK